jgi:hypothetical protein
MRWFFRAATWAPTEPTPVMCTCDDPSPAVSPQWAKASRSMKSSEEPTFVTATVLPLSWSGCVMSGVVIRTNTGWLTKPMTMTWCWPFASAEMTAGPAIWTNWTEPLTIAAAAVGLPEMYSRLTSRPFCLK